MGMRMMNDYGYDDNDSDDDAQATATANDTAEADAKADATTIVLTRIRTLRCCNADALAAVCGFAAGGIQ